MGVDRDEDEISARTAGSSSACAAGGALACTIGSATGGTLTCSADDSRRGGFLSFLGGGKKRDFPIYFYAITKSFHAFKKFNCTLD